MTAYERLRMEVGALSMTSAAATMRRVLIRGRTLLSPVCPVTGGQAPAT